MPDFKDMLKYYRERMGLSQREFAQRIGLAPSTVGMYEKGKRHPDNETEERIADFFNVSLDNLRGRDDEASTLPHRKDEEEILEIYNQMDSEDKAEYRGIGKGILRSEKYRQPEEQKKRA